MKKVNESEEIDLDAIICDTIEPDMEPITMRNLIKAVEDGKKVIGIAGSYNSFEEYQEAMNKIIEEAEREGNA